MALIALLLGMAVAPDPVVSPEAQAAGREFRDDGPKLVIRLEALAAAGDDSANEFLGEIYHRGGFPGIQPDQQRACAYFEKTATRRGDSAQNFANCFYWGTGRPRDWPRARLLYQRAATLGWPSAPCALGNMLVRGEGGPVDEVGGVRLCRQAAEAGNADAQTDLGNYFLQGVGTRQDIVEARQWYTRAAEQGQGNAALVLGQIHWNGDGTPKDRAQAARWWLVAHKAGRKDAAYLLGDEAFGRSIVDEGGKKLFDQKMGAEARGWYAIAADTDPDAERRKTARERIALLDGFATGK